jgi:hypothetical protein
MNKKQNQELTEADLINELNYLISEGFVVYNPVDETYRLKTQEEIKKELENV